MKFKTIDVVSAACAIHRISGGYYKTDSEHWPNTSRPLWSNRRLLNEHLAIDGNFEKVIITDEDTELAEKAINYLKGLGLKRFERDLSDYESKVLKLVAYEDFDLSTNYVGIAASLPATDTLLR